MLLGVSAAGSPWSKNSRRKHIKIESLFLLHTFLSHTYFQQKQKIELSTNFHFLQLSTSFGTVVEFLPQGSPANTQTGEEDSDQLIGKASSVGKPRYEVDEDGNLKLNLNLGLREYDYSQIGTSDAGTSIRFSYRLGYGILNFLRYACCCVLFGGAIGMFGCLLFIDPEGAQTKS